MRKTCLWERPLTLPEMNLLKNESHEGLSSRTSVALIEDAKSVKGWNEARASSSERCGLVKTTSPLYFSLVRNGIDVHETDKPR